MRPLDSKGRARAKRASIGLCVAALALAPLAAPMDFRAEAGALSPERRVPALPKPSKKVVKTLPIERDPFVPDGAAVSLDDGAPPTGADDGFALPPNDGANAALEPDLALVQAVVMGNVPRALIRIGERTRIVGVGDVVNGSKIVRIEAGGIRLESGDTVPLAVPK